MRPHRYNREPEDGAILQCIDCEVEFLFTDREAELWAERGWAPPKRCRACREIEKQRRNDAA